MKKWAACLGGLILAAAVWAAVPRVTSAQAVDEQPPPAAEFLAAALNSQADSCKTSVEVKFRYWQVGHEDDNPFELRYIRTPRMLYMEMKDKRGAKSVDCYDRVTRKFRGLFTPPSGRGTGWISNRPQSFLRMPFDPVLRPVADGFLADLVARGNVSAAKSAVDGHECDHIITLRDDEPGTKQVQVWLDSKIGYCPRRIETNYTNRAPMRNEFVGYKEVAPGVWFPSEIHYKTHNPDKTLPEKLQGDVSHIARADSIKVGATYSREDLAVEFPSGTEVTDDILDATYKVP